MGVGELTGNAKPTPHNVQGICLVGCLGCGENHQPRSASAPRLGDSPEREPWELAQNQPDQVDTLSEENNLDQYTEMERAAGGENLPLDRRRGDQVCFPNFRDMKRTT